MICFSSNNAHELRAEKQMCSSVDEEGQAITGSEMLKENCGSVPTPNALQCASATCFCHRFAMLSCLNLIGWRGGP